MLGADWFAHLEAECAEAPQKWATSVLQENHVYFCRLNKI